MAGRKGAVFAGVISQEGWCFERDCLTINLTDLNKNNSVETEKMPYKHGYYNLRHVWNLLSCQAGDT